MRTVRIRVHPPGLRPDRRLARAESRIAYWRARPRNRIAIVPEGESAAVRTPGLRFSLPSRTLRPEAPERALSAIVADWRMSVPDYRPPRPGWIVALPGASFIRLAGSRADGASGPCAFVRESREPMALPARSTSTIRPTGT